ncbi:MAG: dihydroorotate dehydrogenase electron transfer subunit [Candidatus Omnitrophica bacterium]|nr:dihydroorotate dehydrogenase electron transfer subunit [Candidatus Omnitrophota bacterium]
MKDIKAKILSNKKIGNGYYKLMLDAPYIAQAAKPGQFVQVRCSDGLDPLLRRPFSIHRVTGQRPTGNGPTRIEILYEVIGKGTEILSKKRKGKFLDVLGPLGNGFTLPRKPKTENRATIITGGIGVAPMVFLAERLAKKPTVLIGARTKDLILCEKDFKDMGAEVHIATDDGSQGHKGFVPELLGTRDKGQGTRVYACGPNAMLKSVTDICKKRKLECEVSLEETMACGIGACLGCAVKMKDGTSKLACKDGPVFNANNFDLAEAGPRLFKKAEVQPRQR